MQYTENAINILNVKTYKGIGRAWINKNLKGKEGIDKIVALLNSNSKQDTPVTCDDFEFKRDELLKQIELLDDSCDGVVALGDKHFPKYRGYVKESERPVLLFYKGDITLLDIENPNITVIGLLNPNEEIELREQKIVTEIVKRDITVISGLAFGCDSIAHKQALAGGKTIAILPSPLDNILPARNKSLAFQIVESGGLLITEYYDKHKSAIDLNIRYKDRDRLQALYCDAIILAASYAQDSATRWKINEKLDSGARLAMGYAKEYNIPRYVMYDQNSDVSNPMFDLNRQVLSERDAKVLTKKVLGEAVERIYLQKTNLLDTTSHKKDLFT